MGVTEGLKVQYRTGPCSRRVGHHRRVLSRGKPESDLGLKALWLLCRVDCRAGGGDVVGMMSALLHGDREKWSESGYILKRLCNNISYIHTPLLSPTAPSPRVPNRSRM